MGNAKYSNSHRYSTAVEDNMSLKEARLFEKQLAKQMKLLAESAILTSEEPVNTVQDLIRKYSNNDHEVYYHSQSHSITIRGTMYVSVFHLFVLDSRKFNFTNITLES